MNQEDMASAPYLAGQPLVGDVVAVGRHPPAGGRPCDGAKPDRSPGGIQYA
ncbi:hypothetical protein ACU4GD_44290 [Cupriavidus basilensis]